MRANTLRRVLAAVCLLSGVWALVLMLSGGGSVHLGTWRVSSSTARNPLLIALVSGLLAWFLALTDRSDGDRRRRGPAFVTALTLLAIGLNVMLQATPPQPSGVFTCYGDQQLRGGFRFQLNCDSMEFMYLADEPSLVFMRPIRQGRPLSFIIPFVVAFPLRVLPDFEIMPVGPPLQKSFFGFAIVNLATLVIALLLFTLAYERGTGWRAGPEWLFVAVVLAANEITKMFVWIPHVQILNVLTPCLTIYLNLRLLERSSPLTSGRAIAMGAAIGAALLLYGSFVIPLVCVITIQWFVYRRVWSGLLTGMSASLVYLTWMAVLFLQTGRVYNHEVVVYRQFVWIADCLAAHTCGNAVATNATAFFNATAAVLAIPAVLAVATHVARVLRTDGSGTVTATPRTLLQATALTWVVTFAFVALAGFYSPRLSWMLVPPVLMLVALEGGTMWRAAGSRRPWAVSIVLVAICIAHVLILAARQGPYW
jgi:hypothetical protein